MQSVCKFYQHNLRPECRPGENLAMSAFGDGLFITRYVCNLGTTLHDRLNIAAEFLSDKLTSDLFHILNRIMQESRGKNFRMEDIHLFSKNLGNRTWVENIRISGTSPLIEMSFSGKVKSFPESFFPRCVTYKRLHQVAIKL